MSHMKSRLQWASIFLVLGVAAVLRLWDLSTYPQGFHYDEAVNLIVSREIAFQGSRPFPVFAAFNGREVLYYYLSAVGMIGLGQSIFTMRLISAFSNLLTVALTIGIGQTMFGKSRGTWIGLMAGGFMAVSFPQLFIARQGFRAVTLPLMQALSLWLLMRGLRQPKFTAWLPLAGLMGGAVLYTYMASRLWPMWLALYMLIYIFSQRDNRMFRFQQGLIVGIFLLIAAAPLLNYYAQNPDVFNDRLDQLSGDEDTPSYGESIWLHTKMFLIEGDPYIRYNDPGRPYFDPASGLLFSIGIGVSAVALIKSRNPTERSNYALILLAPLMIAPSVLAVGGLPPSHMRSIGMVPLVFYLPALGLEQAGRWLETIRPLRLAATPAFIAWGLLLLVALNVGREYRNWAAEEDLFYLTDGDMIAAGAWLEDHSNDDTLIYITSQHYDHPSLQIYDLPGDNITYLLGDRFYFPPVGRDAYFVEIPNAPLAPIFADYAAIFGEPMPHYNAAGQLAFTIYPYSGRAMPEPTLAPSDSIGGWLRLHDTQLDTAISGQSVTILTQWEILSPPPYPDFTPLFQLETQEGDVLDRVEPYSARTDFWHTGETLIQSVTFDVPPATPPDDYVVQVAWVGRNADEYAGRLDENGRFAGIWTRIGTMAVKRPNTMPDHLGVTIPVVQAANLDAIQLIGRSILPSEIRPGESIHLDLYWHALAQPSAQTLQIIAVGSDGTEHVWWDAAPVMGRYPFNQWQVGEWVTDRHRWRVPTDMVGGDYTLWLGVADQRVELGRVHVAELMRDFDPPAPMVTQTINFGNVVQLIGYDLSGMTFSRGDSVQLTLYWQSLAATDLPLTVFVHLTDPTGVNQAQQDTQPRQNNYPIALWVPGEYVDDRYTIRIPENAPTGIYSLRIGLYLQTNGQRLQIVDHNTDFWTIASVMVE